MVRDPIGRTNVPGSSVSTLYCRHYTEDRLRVIRSGTSTLIIQLLWNARVFSVKDWEQERIVLYRFAHCVIYAEIWCPKLSIHGVPSKHKREVHSYNHRDGRDYCHLYCIHFLLLLPISYLWNDNDSLPSECFHAYPWIEADPIDETVYIPNRLITHKKGSRLSAFPPWLFSCLVLFLPDTWRVGSSFRMFYSMTRAGLTVIILSHLSLLCPSLSAIEKMPEQYLRERVPCQYRPVMIALIYPYLLLSALISQIFFWFKANPHAKDSRGVIIGNRWLDCENRSKSIGYLVFYDYQEQ